MTDQTALHAEEARKVLLAPAPAPAPAPTLHSQPGLGGRDLGAGGSRIDEIPAPLLQ